MAARISDVKIDVNAASSPSNSPGADKGVEVGNSTLDQRDGLVPDQYLFTDEGRISYITYGVPLYQAAMKGDVEEVGRIIGQNQQALRQSVTEGMETVLHIAALGKQVQLVEKLVEWIKAQGLKVALRLRNRDGNTALSFAAISGIVPLAELMVNEDQSLPKIRNNARVTPLHLAALLGHRDMVKYLYEHTDDDLTDAERHGIFIICIRTGLYDVAFDIQNKEPSLATKRGSYQETALHVLAQKPLLFSVNENQLGIYSRIISRSGMNHDSLKLDQALQLVKSLWEKVLQQTHERMWSLVEHPTVLMLDAAEAGNVEFLVQLINLYPDLIWRVNGQKQSIFHYAILYRHESVFSLIQEIGSIKDLIATYEDDNNNNMLHLAARLPPQDRLKIVSGAALQMQRELLWFQEVERLVQPSCREQRNNEHFTPWELFMEQHKGLMKEGEEWMKKTAESSLMVPTLIATVAFASIFTVPGGSKDNSGEPNFLRRMSFLVFVTSDATALFSALASILMFLSILTSRYKEHDFIKRLPFMLMIGLATFFMSIGSVIVAFSATVFIIYYHGHLWVPAAIAILGSVPIALFASLNLPLFIDVWNSTYGSRSLFHPRNKLFKQPYHITSP
ncbi:Ankyrin repeat family protein, putative [Theobroma cacao]|uniref:Ankyrin repeat family protein, putative n=1 Tax=Theobroma cacao TaxID=3641 RepID=A0A061DXU3_THECC|nr:Ankyrin repeat family protein, putative [Theobroma cacao]